MYKTALHVEWNESFCFRMLIGGQGVISGLSNSFILL